ncbi:hypothetical protein [Actinomadura sp. SCN-SB]|uniref:hypothetical protein n=1 Tax=Actinomadura sp. SCN-SB TaxID=3373092 RepID=UPI0037536A56
MYVLEAVIGTAPVLEALAGSMPEARIVPLAGRLSLLPMTQALLDAVTVPGESELDGFLKAPAGFGRTLAACSKTGPVAYVEAGYFGGSGTQSAQVWDAGEVVLGPLRKGEFEPSPPAGSPISQALRLLGVDKGGHVDEFEAAGLHRHRATSSWLPAV